MTGREAAELFYDNTRMQRSGAAPTLLQKTLFGKGGVQALDDEAHQHRKAMFMSLMTPRRVEDLISITQDLWREACDKWAAQEQVVLYDAMHELLTRAVCFWAGVPLVEEEVAERTSDLVALFDAAGAAGPRHFWSRHQRKDADAWAQDLILRIREGQLNPPPECAAHVIAFHHDLEGQPLSPEVAAVELINVLRPTIAVSVYIVHVAHALHQHPDCREKLRVLHGTYADCFVQEVRRHYPFFPSVMALTREAFEWNGYHFPAKERVVLDIYGTNHDVREWDAPDEFRPERFAGGGGCPYSFIPQGGGEHAIHHRCPGEFITLALMKFAARQLAAMEYEVPPQDLELDFQRLPALPKSRFIIAGVKC